MKHKVITDNLDFLNIPKNTIISNLRITHHEYRDYGTTKESSVTLYYPNIGQESIIEGELAYNIYQAIQHNPSWFQEIEEDEFEFDEKQKFSELLKNATDKIIIKGNYNEYHYLDSLVYISDNLNIDIDVRGFIAPRHTQTPSDVLEIFKYNGIYFFVRKREYDILFPEIKKEFTKEDIISAVTYAEGKNYIKCEQLVNRWLKWK